MQHVEQGMNGHGHSMHLQVQRACSVHDSFCCVQVQQLMATAPLCAELRDLHSTLLQVRQNR